MEVVLKYGKGTQSAELPDANYAGELAVGQDLEGCADHRVEVQRALRDPIGSRPLADYCAPGKMVAIVVNDHTRKTPTKLMLPPVLDELNLNGIPDEDITVVFGCGTHRPVTDEEAKGLLGPEVLSRVRTENHDCRAGDLVHVGTTTRGNDVWINHTVAKADLRILTGDIEYHYFAGYSGGRKSVLPAVAGEETIRRNHANLLDPKASTGNLEGNPIHEEMVEAARLAGVHFIVNTVNNTKREIVRCFAGDLEAAHLEGTRMVDSMYKVPLPEPADVVVVSSGGAPKDIDMYQGLKAVDNALRAVRRGGALVALLEAPEGLGNKVFDEWIRKYHDIEELEHLVRTGFIIGGHKAYYVRKYNEWARVFMVTSMSPHDVEDVMGLTRADHLQDGLDMALEHVGMDARVLVIPSGDKILPVLGP